MKKRINFLGLRWGIAEAVGVAVGLVVTIIVLFYLSTKIEERAFLSSLAVIVTAIAALIAALSLKRTIDTVRPFLTLTKTELLLDESLHEAVMRLNIRNTGSTPAEKVSIELSLSALEDKSTNKELMSQVIKSPTIFPTEERIITYYPRSELLNLIETDRAKLKINITYQSAQKKYYTARTMNILKAKGLDEGRFIFGFVDAEDSWD